MFDGLLMPIKLTPKKWIKQSCIPLTDSGDHTFGELLAGLVLFEVPLGEVQAASGAVGMGETITLQCLLTSGLGGRPPSHPPISPHQQWS